MTLFFYRWPGEEEIVENSIPPNSATDEVSSPEALASEEVEKEQVVAETPVDEVKTPAPVVTEASSEESGNTATAESIKGPSFVHPLPVLLPDSWPNGLCEIPSPNTKM